MITPTILIHALIASLIQGYQNEGEWLCGVLIIPVLPCLILSFHWGVIKNQQSYNNDSQ